MSKLKVKVIVASTRPNRFSEKPASLMFDEAKKREDLDVELVDLRDYPLPFFEEPLPPGFVGPDNYPKPHIMKWREKVVDGEAFIICTPEYNHGYPAVLKNALDYVYYDWSRKPVAFVSWGGAGGTRGVEQLRLVAVELDMAPLRFAVHIQNPWLVKDVEDLRTDANLQGMKVLLDQITWWGNALKGAKKS